MNIFWDEAWNNRKLSGALKCRSVDGAFRMTLPTRSPSSLRNAQALSSVRISTSTAVISGQLSKIGIWALTRLGASPSIKPLADEDRHEIDHSVVLPCSVRNHDVCR